MVPTIWVDGRLSLTPVTVCYLVDECRRPQRDITLPGCRREAMEWQPHFNSHVTGRSPQALQPSLAEVEHSSICLLPDFSSARLEAPDWKRHPDCSLLL
ncbi:UNVERIFIED_CONTAM: hypothetical protein K2H54_066984 [Gekko kuhli]